MSLSNLNKIFTGSLPPVTAYIPTPTSQYSNPNAPESEVSFNIVGSLNSNTNIMVFEVTDQANTGSTLTLGTDTTKNTIVVTDATSQNRQTQSTYYMVDFGSDTSRPEWSISFTITLKDGTTGEWVFQKKKIGDDEEMTNPY